MMDTITAPPMMVSTVTPTRVFKVDLDGVWSRSEKLAAIPRDHDATVASYLIEAPWSHPVWHSYWLALVHLRPLPRPVETKFYLTGATHEMWLYALDPDHPRQRLLDLGDIHVLEPKNFASQMICADDAEAMGHVENALHRICDGTLSPDTDYLRLWCEIFGDNMIRGGMLGARH